MQIQSLLVSSELHYPNIGDQFKEATNEAPMQHQYQINVNIVPHEPSPDLSSGQPKINETREYKMSAESSSSWKMSNEMEKDLQQVNADDQEAKDQPVEQVPNPVGHTPIPAEQPRTEGDGSRSGHKAPVTSAEPPRPAAPSRKRTIRGEMSGASGETPSRQGYSSLRMRAENHPDVLREKKNKGGKSSRSTEDK
ncbi:hypothetical protein Pfo_006370 [Paulownia fortunei]|nr:hypothetical protein Pfo_006370 [Paulownia fortunei]